MDQLSLSLSNELSKSVQEEFSISRVAAEDARHYVRSFNLK